MIVPREAPPLGNDSRAIVVLNAFAQKDNFYRLCSIKRVENAQQLDEGTTRPSETHFFCRHP
jgi:hypothetical protein